MRALPVLLCLTQFSWQIILLPPLQTYFDHPILYQLCQIILETQICDPLAVR